MFSLFQSGRKLLFYVLAVLFICSGMIFAVESESTVPQRVMDLREAAAACIKAKNYTDACSHYQSIIQEFPGTGYATRSRADLIRVQLCAGEMDTAKSAVEAMFTSHPTAPEFALHMHHLGQDFRDRKDYTTAMGIFTRLRSDFSDYENPVPLQCSIINTHIQAGQTQQALTEIDRAFSELSTNPAFVENMVDSACDFTVKKDYENARLLCQRLLNLQPAAWDEIEVRDKLARIHIAVGDLEAVEAEVDTMFTLVSGEDSAIKTLYKFAKFRARPAKQYALEQSIYDRLLQRFPDHEYAMGILSSKAGGYLKQGDDSQAAVCADALFATYSAHPDFVENLYKLASKRARPAKQYDLERSIYDRLLQRFPDHEKAMRTLSSKAVSYLKQGDYSQAGTCVDALFTTYSAHPDFVEKLYKFASQRARPAKQYDLEQSIYDRLLQRFPDHEIAMQVLLSKAGSCLEQGDYVQAAACVDALYATYSAHPDFVENLYKFASKRLRPAKQYDLEQSIYDRLLQRFPEHENAIGILSSKAGSCLKQGDYLKAGTCVDALFATYSAHPDFVENLRELASQRARPAKQYDLERSIYDRLLQRFPDHEYAMRILSSKAGSYLEQGDYVQATACVDALFATYSVHPDFVKNLRKLASQRARPAKQYALEQSIYDRLQEFPDHEKAMQVLVSKAAGCLEQGDYVQATACVDALFATYSVHPDFVEKLYALARLNVRPAKQYDLEQSIYGRLLQGFPNHERAPEILAKKIKGYLNLNDTAAADAKIEEMFAQYAQPADIFLPAVNGVIFRYDPLNNSGKVIELCNRVLSMYPDHEKSLLVYIKLIKACLAGNLKTQADAAADQLVQNYSDHPDLAATLGRIAHNYRKSKHYAKSTELNQIVLAHAGDDKKVQLAAHAEIAKAAVWLEQAAADPNAPAVAAADVDATVQQLMTDYPHVKKLGYHIFQIGEQYYYRAEKAESEGNKEQAQADLQKAIAVWEKNIHDIADIRYQAMAYYGTGVSYWRLSQYFYAADAFLASIEIDPGHKHAGSMCWLVSDCYEKLKRDGEVTADEADPLIEWGYQTLFDNYPDSRDVEYAAIQLGKLHLARGEPVSACTYFNWYLDHTHADNGQIADIGRIMETMEGCGQ